MVELIHQGARECVEECVCSLASSAIAEDCACSLAASAIADGLVLEGMGLHGWFLRWRGRLPFFSSGGIARKYQGQRREARGNRRSIRLLAAPCSISERSHPCWLRLRYSKVELMRLLHGGCCAPKGGKRWMKECQILQIYCFTPLMTNRKKSRSIYAPSTSSCLRVKVCLPGIRSVLDQSIC